MIISSPFKFFSVAFVFLLFSSSNYLTCAASDYFADVVEAVVEETAAEVVVEPEAVTDVDVVVVPEADYSATYTQSIEDRQSLKCSDYSYIECITKCLIVPHCAKAEGCNCSSDGF